jgi:hypothetical protein
MQPERVQALTFYFKQEPGQGGSRVNDQYSARWASHPAGQDSGPHRSPTIVGCASFKLLLKQDNSLQSKGS